MKSGNLSETLSTAKKALNGIKNAKGLISNAKVALKGAVKNKVNDMKKQKINQLKSGALKKIKSKTKR